MNARQNKLSVILAGRYRELAFNSPKETWREYLEKNGMMKCEDWRSVSEFAHFEVVQDPSPFGKFIIIPGEIATRILVLGAP